MIDAGAGVGGACGQQRRRLAGPDAAARDNRLSVAQVEAERDAVAADGLADLLQRFE